MEFMDSWTMLYESNVHLRKVWKHHAENFESVNYMDEEVHELATSGGVDDNKDVEELLYRHTFWVIVILIVGYSVVLVFGLLGNFSVLVVVARTPRMVTVTNLFICNLALADLLVLIFCILPNLVSNIYVRKSIYKIKSGYKRGISTLRKVVLL
jgi:hypothetical protein